MDQLAQEVQRLTVALQEERQRSEDLNQRMTQMSTAMEALQANQGQTAGVAAATGAGIEAERKKTEELNFRITQLNSEIISLPQQVAAGRPAGMPGSTTDNDLASGRILMRANWSKHQISAIIEIRSN